MTLENSSPQPSQSSGLQDLIYGQPKVAMGLGIAAIILLTLVAYLPAIFAGYIWEDSYYITNNALLQRGDGLGRIWTGVVPSPANYPLPQYYPLTYTTFWIEYRLWGVQPAGYHAVNLAIHICNALLVWLLLRKLDVPGAFLAGLIFALHPVNVETVAWVTQRTNCLATFFFLASLYVYLRHSGVIGRPEGRGHWFTLPDDPNRVYWLAVILFACALFSKTISFSMPAVALVLIYWKRGRLSKEDLSGALPVLGAGIVMGLLTAYMEYVRVGISIHPQYWDYSPSLPGEIGARLIIAGQAVCFYAYTLLVPYPLIFNYPRWAIDPGNVGLYLFPIAVVLVVASLVFARKWIGAGPLVAVVVFLITLFPALGFVNVWTMRYAFVADHFVYLSSIALIAVLSAAIVRYLTLDIAATLVTLIALVVLGLTWTRSKAFVSDQTIWEDTIKKTNQKSWLATNQYGAWFRDESRRQDSYDLSERWLKVSNRNNPAVPEPLYNLALLYEFRGQVAENVVASATQPSTQVATTIPATNPQGFYQQAVEYYKRSLEIDPNFALSHFRLASRLEIMGQVDDARAHFTKALEIHPRSPSTLRALANLELGQNKPAAAVPYLRQIVELDPESGRAHADLGSALMQSGNILEGQQRWDAAMRLDPLNPILPNELAVWLATHGDFPRASLYFAQAYQLNPSSPEILTNVGVVAARLGDLEKAKLMFSEALKIDPDFAKARQNLVDLESGRLRPATTRASTGPGSGPATSRGQ